MTEFLTQLGAYLTEEGFTQTTEVAFGISHGRLVQYLSRGW